MINLLFKIGIVITTCLMAISGALPAVVRDSAKPAVVWDSAEVAPSVTESIGNVAANAEKANYYDEKKATRGTYRYDNINGEQVIVDLLRRAPNELLHNPTFAEAELINNSINYKLKHPSENVEIRATSFHFSVVVAACLDKEDPNYGMMKNIYNAEEQDNYIRLSYLLVKAAMIGINVTVIGQIDGGGTRQLDSKGQQYVRSDIDFDKYFKGWLNKPCADGLSDKKISDYLKFKKSGWTSYGDRSAADMMHLKVGSVSHLIGNDGNEYHNAVYFSSTNIDGVDYRGSNGNNAVQTGTIIYNHKEIFDCSANYIDLLYDYSDQESIYEFREIIRSRNYSQRSMILAGNYALIPQDEKILYLGTDSDNTFELFFTPYAGAVGSFDTRFNPIAKHTAKMLESTDYIEYSLYCAKFSTSNMTNIWMNMINKAFVNANNPKSDLRVYISGFDKNRFKELKVGTNVKSITVKSASSHNKDILLSYADGDTREYLSMITSMNFHDGAFFYQANFALAIKENSISGNNFYARYQQLAI